MKKTPNTTKAGRLIAAIATGLALAGGITTASAADRTWNAGGDQFSWSDGANWGGSAPVATDSLFFGGTVGTNNNNDLTPNTVFNGITFNSGAGPFTMTGSQVNLGGGVTNNSTSLQTISLTLANNGANRNYVTASGDLDCAQVNGNTIIKSGPGTLTLSGTADNSSLGTTVNQGVVVLAKPSTSLIHALGGTITVNTNGILRIAGTGGDQIFYNAGITMNSGTLQVQASEEARNLNGTGTVENGLAGTTNTYNLQSNNGNRGTFGGFIRDNGGVLNIELHRHNNIQVLNGTNTYTGTTMIDNTTGSGTSRLIVNAGHTGGGDYTVFGNAAANLAVLGGSGTISATKIDINNYGILAPGGSLSGSTYSDTTAILTISNAVNLNTSLATLDVALNGTTAGTGYDQVNIAGSGTFSNNSANLKITVGSVSVGDKFTIVQVQGTDAGSNIGTFATLNGLATDLSQGATFVDSGSGKTFQISYRAEGSTFDMGVGSGNDIMLQVVTPGGGNLTWRGNGVNNNWDVNTTADWWNGSSLVTFTNGDLVTFDNTGSNNIPVNLVGNLSPANLSVNATKDYILAGGGKLTGTVVLTKTNSGTLTMLTDNDYVGATVIQGGTLQLGTNGITGSIAGSATVNSGGTLAYNRSDDITITNVAFAGAGSVAHKGGGKMIVAANITSPGYTGTTVVNAGELQLGDGTGTVGSLGGQVSIGATNTLHYYHTGTGANSTVGNSLAGSGTVIYDYPGILFHTYTIPTSIGNSNFTGTNILKANVKVDVPTDGLGNAFGNGGVVDATASGCKVSIGRTAIPYNQTFLIAGLGWSGEFPYLGALQLWRASITGPIVLSADSAVRVSGGTLWGQITGAYNLDLQSDTNGYPNDVLTLNPTNGANSYGNTTISGYIRAANPGALSTNGLAVDIGGRLNIYGTTVTVANLQNGLSGGGRIDNGSGAASGTLTVGTDGTSTSFDGVFGNGGSQQLNLTKVGAGTLTLSGVSTNTGVVTVNGGTLALSGAGSFANASKLVANATLDVSGIGGTLTLISGQTLGGSGTVAGDVIAPTDSTVSPGASIGTLTVGGNVSLGGTLLMECNRTNAPFNCDRLVSSGGTITYGGSLLVTNIGPVLQVNDTFQLFPTGVPAYTGNTTLATTDALGATYTWQNDIATLGSVKVLSVTGLVNTTPTNIVATVSGGNLNLSWPSDHTGWSLQSQTNALGVGLSTNWVTVPGSTATNAVSIPISPANPAVFFRLQYP
jgi:fibronectin-binding autotransporter adhesin